VIGEYVYDDQGGRHQAFYSPTRDTVVMGDLIRSHDRIKVEESLKYSGEGAQRLWSSAGMTEIDQWTYGNEYGEWIHDPPLSPLLQTSWMGWHRRLEGCPIRNPASPFPHVFPLQLDQSCDASSFLGHFLRYTSFVLTSRWWLDCGGFIITLGPRGASHHLLLGERLR